MAKHMRLPNGFGQISKLNQRLRNPYRAMVTIDWTNEGKPVRKIVGYYKTYNEAYKALTEYHRDPSVLSNVSMPELYDRWLEEFEKHAPSQSATANYASAWKYAKCLYKYKVRDVRSYHIKETVEADMPPSTHRRLHTLLNLMFDYAVEYDLTDRNYSRLARPVYDTKAVNPDIHFAFDDSEISILWENVGKSEAVDMALIQIYMGWRPQELVKIRNSDVNINRWTITGGMKTAAGSGRVVPIHERIRPLVEKYHSNGNIYLFGEIHTYNRYYERFIAMIANLGLNQEHVPHNPRKTFSTLCKRFGVDEYARKKFMGRALNDIDDKYYTDLPADWFENEISKIKV